MMMMIAECWYQRLHEWRPADCDWTQPRLRSCGQVAYQSAAGQDHHQRRAVSVDQHNCSSRFSERLRCHYQQSSRTCRSGYTSCANARSLSTDATKTLVQAFVSRRLDWTIAMHCCMVSDELMRRVQSVQKPAARVRDSLGQLKTHLFGVLYWDSGAFW